MKKQGFLGVAICAATLFGTVGTAFAGEVTGTGKQTPIGTYAVTASACSFSGLEDGYYIIPPDFQTEYYTPNNGPGWTQTPHIESGVPGAQPYPPGVAGFACRGATGGGGQ
jgi:hypothetical protein